MAAGGVRSLQETIFKFFYRQAYKRKFKSIVGLLIELTEDRY
ncbi:hypothetical protein SAMN05216332_11638 [Nitrosospira briensis]|nr:hypothetical protein SAMN05216332_11638 [Nitrosospira briensis]